jgi:hypothetical protein
VNLSACRSVAEHAETSEAAGADPGELLVVMPNGFGFYRFTRPAADEWAAVAA